MRRLPGTSCGRSAYACVGVGGLSVQQYLFKADVCDATDYDTLQSPSPVNPNNFKNLPQAVETAVARVDYHDLAGCAALISTFAACRESFQPFTEAGFIDAYTAVYTAADVTLKAALRARSCYAKIGQTPVSPTLALYTPGMLQPTAQAMLDIFDPLPAMAIPSTAVNPSNYDDITKAAAISLNALQDAMAQAADCNQFQITSDYSSDTFAVSTGHMYVQGQDVLCQGITGTLPGSSSVSFYATAVYDIPDKIWIGGIDLSPGSNDATHRSIYIGSISGAFTQKPDLDMNKTIVMAPQLPTGLGRWVYRIVQGACGPLFAGQSQLPKPTAVGQVLVSVSQDADDPTKQPFPTWSDPPSGAGGSGIFTWDGDLKQSSWVCAIKDEANPAQALPRVSASNTMQWFRAPQTAVAALTSSKGLMSWISSDVPAAFVCTGDSVDDTAISWYPYTPADAGGRIHACIEDTGGVTAMTAIDSTHGSVGVLGWATSQYTWVYASEGADQTPPGGVLTHAGSTMQWTQATTEQADKPLILTFVDGVWTLLELPGDAKYVLTGDGTAKTFSWIQYATCDQT